MIISTFIIPSNVITIVNYDRKTFIVQATDWHIFHVLSEKWTGNLDFTSFKCKISFNWEVVNKWLDRFWTTNLVQLNLDQGLLWKIIDKPFQLCPLYKVIAQISVVPL